MLFSHPACWFFPGLWCWLQIHQLICIRMNPLEWNFIHIQLWLPSLSWHSRFTSTTLSSAHFLNSEHWLGRASCVMKTWTLPLKIVSNFKRPQQSIQPGIGPPGLHLNKSWACEARPVLASAPYPESAETLTGVSLQLCWMSTVLKTAASCTSLGYLVFQAGGVSSSCMEAEVISSVSVPRSCLCIKKGLDLFVWSGGSVPCLNLFEVESLVSFTVFLS